MRQGKAYLRTGPTPQNHAAQISQRSSKIRRDGGENGLDNVRASRRSVAAAASRFLKRRLFKTRRDALAGSPEHETGERSDKKAASRRTAGEREKKERTPGKPEAEKRRKTAPKSRTATKGADREAERRDPAPPFEVFLQRRRDPSPPHSPYHASPRRSRATLIRALACHTPAASAPSLRHAPQYARLTSSARLPPPLPLRLRFPPRLRSAFRSRLRFPELPCSHVCAFCASSYPPCPIPWPSLSLRRTSPPTRTHPRKKRLQVSFSAASIPPKSVLPARKPPKTRKLSPSPLDTSRQDIKTYKNSQGGVKVPTGGDPPIPRGSPRARFQGKKRRSGANPGPTVTVRKKENGFLASVF